MKTQTNVKPQNLVGAFVTIGGRFMRVIDYRTFNAAQKTFLEVQILDVTENSDKKDMFDVVELTPDTEITFAPVNEVEAESKATRRIEREYARLSNEVLTDMQNLRDSLTMASMRINMGHTHAVEFYGISEILHGNLITRVIGNVGLLKGLEYALDAINR